MDLEYRQLDPHEESTFKELIEYSMPPVLEYLDGPEHYSTRVDMMEKWGLFDDEMRAAIGHERFDLKVREQWLDTVGSLVAVDPTERERGLTETMLRETYREFRDRGIVLAAGWPFDREFYRQYHSATLARFARVDGPISSLPARPIERELELVSETDYEQLDTVYRTFIADYDFTPDRTAEWWTAGLFESEETHAVVLGATDPVGYLVYRIVDHTFVVDDVAFASECAWIDLLNYIRRHASQATSFHVTLPTDVELLALLSDPAAVDYEVVLGPVGRVLEFPTAVERLDYGTTDATLTVAVEDDVATWNDGTFEVTVRDGDATVTESTKRPDVRLDIGTFTQLFVGYGGVERAMLTGTFQAHTDGVVETLATLYPQRSLFCPDRF
ncbi:enhanced intracellular survival protein Eis [Haloarcula sp. JP-L23]|uniref:GNAT family N-acetyltransferase n=1 Tax=Haloarcula sp. JP-L23 TaxID=2716717 RepID=UPI00140F496D|nr:GNAT family N-acetyltransferase [Haloarcula sp. JP-L23]